MTRLEDRQTLMAEIASACAAGARLAPACGLAGIDLRAFQRWRAEDGQVRADRRPEAVRPRPRHALSEAERARMVELANAPRFASTPPARIVPALADEGVYVASEASFHRVLRDHGQMRRRGRARPPRTVGPPSTHVATAPGQVWCWDVTFLKARVQGCWFYLFLILDLWSRKIVGYEVHETDQAEHAAHLVRRTALAEGIHARALRPVLHGDNGPSVKATTVAAMLHWLGIAPSHSRPRVSDDNAYAEALFRTAKYRPDFPSAGFADLAEARQWAAAFVRWYNHEHRHSGIRYVTPAQRHAGGRRQPRPRRPPCPVPASARGQSAPLERAHPRLDPDRGRHAQSRARQRRRHSDPDPALWFDGWTCSLVPTWRPRGHGAQQRRWEARSRPQPRAAERAWRGGRAPHLRRREHRGSLTHRRAAPRCTHRIGDPDTKPARQLV
jgi:putative transposase